ncbi:S8 family serine peptidase [Blastococcus sp. SYSU DS0617]
MLLPLAGLAPAQADPAPAPLDLPGALAAELSAAEEASLTSLTSGAGVRIEAFVETPSGPEIVVLEAGSAAAGREAAALLEDQPSVDGAGLSRPVHAVAGSAYQYGNELIRSDAGRAAVDGDLSQVVVAVLDTGVADHPELSGALLPGQNFTTGDPTDWTDRDGHGTHVAGTVAATVGGAIEGVAAGARILPVKVLDDTGSGTTDSAAAGIVWATDNGADVINMSYGSPWAAAAQTSAIAYARSRGVTVIAAVGNDDLSIPFYPAADPGVVAVSAVDQHRAKAAFSNFGSYVDLSAPGVGILSSTIDGAQGFLSGTSMASPHVAGVAALLEAAAPGLTPDQVEQAMAASVTDLGTAGRDDVFGHGLVDAPLAVQAAERLEAALPVRQPHHPGFVDVPAEAPFAGDIAWLAAEGIAQGGADGRFRPRAPVIRQAMAVFMSKLANGSGVPRCTRAAFPDVPRSSPYCGSITWLAAEGITRGTADGRFLPLATITREAMAAFLYHLEHHGSAPPPCRRAAFSDVPATSPFCGSIAWLAAQGITSSTGRFDPRGEVTRGMMAAFLHRFAQR